MRSALWMLALLAACDVHRSVAGGDGQRRADVEASRVDAPRCDSAVRRERPSVDAALPVVDAAVAVVDAAQPVVDAAVVSPTLDPALADLAVPRDLCSAGAATTHVTIHCNLGSTAATANSPWSAAAPTASSNFSVTFTIYDSTGKPHLGTVYFRKELSAGLWTWHALVDGGEITGGSPGIMEEESSGTLDFDGLGRLQHVSTTTNDYDFALAVQNQAVSFDFGDALDVGGTGLAGSRSTSSTAMVTFVGQDGHPPSCGSTDRGG